jgi:Domain of unknown function (DUF4388)
MVEPARDGSDDLTIRGEIENTSVPELVRSILTSGESGVLTFRNSEFTKSLYVHNSRVLFAASTDPDERLGESLLLRGKISARQYLEASKLIQQGRRLGAILVEMGALDPEDLIPAVEQQVREILMDLFQWTRGEYEFVIKEIDPGDVLALNVAPENLVLEGIRRSRAWSRIYGGIGGLETVPFPTGNTELLYRLELTDDEQEVLSHVNGRSTIEQICQMSYLPNFETCRILWALFMVAIIRRGQSGEDVAVSADVRERENELDLEEVVERFNQMFGRIYGFLRGRLGDEVDQFMDMVMEQVSRQYGTLLAGVDLRGYGRADFEQMLANVADLPPGQRKSLMVAGLNELVYSIQLTVRTRYGADEAAVISGIIKEGFRRLSGA